MEERKEARIESGDAPKEGSYRPSGFASMRFAPANQSKKRRYSQIKSRSKSISRGLKKRKMTND